MIVQTPESRGKRIFLLVFAVCILVPCAFGFLDKLVMFMLALGTKEADGGGFAIVPILNYLLATAGFTCLLFWAIGHGMFRDIEKPKYTMLEREAELDRLDGREWSE